MTELNPELISQIVREADSVVPRGSETWSAVWATLYTLHLRGETRIEERERVAREVSRLVPGTEPFRVKVGGDPVRPFETLSAQLAPWEPLGITVTAVREDLPFPLDWVVSGEGWRVCIPHRGKLTRAGQSFLVTCYLNNTAADFSEVPLTVVVRTGKGPGRREVFRQAVVAASLRVPGCP